jgi:hypothetical protein
MFAVAVLMFAVAVLTMIFAGLTWAEGRKWLPLWASALSRPGAIVMALAFVIVLETWAVVRPQTRLQARLTALEKNLTALDDRFESHDHNDVGWIAKLALKSKAGGIDVRPK